MCIRDRLNLGEVQSVLRNLLRERIPIRDLSGILEVIANNCLLYTSDAADERSSVDLGGRRIIKKKNRV